MGLLSVTEPCSKKFGSYCIFPDIRPRLRMLRGTIMLEFALSALRYLHPCTEAKALIFLNLLINATQLAPMMQLLPMVSVVDA